METSGICPDAIDGVPADEVKVIFEVAGHHGHSECHHQHRHVALAAGGEVSPADATNAPTVVWPASSTSLHTLALIDLDAPSRKNPALRAILHWLVVNVPGKYTSLGDVLYHYSGPKPPPEGGEHRYAVLVYSQPKKLDVSEIPVVTTEKIDKPEGQAPRQRFSIRDFAKNHNLGEPVAGTYFVSKCDEYSAAFWLKFRSKC